MTCPHPFPHISLVLALNRGQAGLRTIMWLSVANVWCHVCCVLSIQSSSQRLRLWSWVAVQSKTWNFVFERLWLVLRLSWGTRKMMLTVGWCFWFDLLPSCLLFHALLLWTFEMGSQQNLKFNQQKKHFVQ